MRIVEARVVPQANAEENRMRGAEKYIVLGSLAYMLVYIPFFFITFASADPSRLFPIIMPFHLLGMGLNFAAFGLTIRDVYLRKLPGQNAKLTWLLLIMMTGGIGWLVYLFKYALKPRESDGGSMDTPNEPTVSAELGKLRNTNAVVIALLSVTLAIVVLLHLIGQFSPHDQGRTKTWVDVYGFLDQGNIKSAVALAKELAGQNPRYYHVYTVLGDAYVADGDLEGAEEAFAEGYRLYPLKQIEERLEAVRALRMRKKDDPQTQ